MSELSREVEARRTFAIISHPDAGKTTITEKLLLLGNAIQVAGTVKGKKGPHATSDYVLNPVLPTLVATPVWGLIVQRP